jgi:hypothetical protein
MFRLGRKCDTGPVGLQPPGHFRLPIFDFRFERRLRQPAAQNGRRAALPIADLRVQIAEVNDGTTEAGATLDCQFWDPTSSALTDSLLRAPAAHYEGQGE